MPRACIRIEKYTNHDQNRFPLTCLISAAMRTRLAAAVPLHLLSYTPRPPRPSVPFVSRSPMLRLALWAPPVVFARPHACLPLFFAHAHACARDLLRFPPGRVMVRAEAKPDVRALLRGGELSLGRNRHGFVLCSVCEESFTCVSDPGTIHPAPRRFPAAPDPSQSS